MTVVANRGTTNFEFLILDWDLKEKYYDRAGTMSRQVYRSNR